ncbi:unnamed protein product [Amoebophrya sp. A120]|nr:unnamed protein product [Amoebophrya sp. A120]|eukprot:GSA120T00022864001.1
MNRMMQRYANAMKTGGEAAQVVMDVDPNLQQPRNAGDLAAGAAGGSSRSGPQTPSLPLRATVTTSANKPPVFPGTTAATTSSAQVPAQLAATGGAAMGHTSTSSGSSASSQLVLIPATPASSYPSGGIGMLPTASPVAGLEAGKHTIPIVEQTTTQPQAAALFDHYAHPNNPSRRVRSRGPSAGAHGGQLPGQGSPQLPPRLPPDVNNSALTPRRASTPARLPQPYHPGGPLVASARNRANSLPAPGSSAGRIIIAGGAAAAEVEGTADAAKLPAQQNHSAGGLFEPQPASKLEQMLPKRRHSSPSAWPNRERAKDDWDFLQNRLREQHTPRLQRVPSVPKLEASFLSQAARVAHRGAKLV